MWLVCVFTQEPGPIRLMSKFYSQSSKASLISPLLGSNVHNSAMPHRVIYAKLIFENWLPVISCLYTNKTIVPTDWSYAKTKVTRPCSRKSSCDPGGFNSQACLVLVLYAILAWKGIYWLIWWVPQLELFYVSWYIYVSTYIEYMRSGLMVVTPVTIRVVFQKWHALTPGQIQPVAHCGSTYPGHVA